MTPHHPGRNGVAFKELSLLYVEDDEDIRNQLSQFLRRRVGTLYTAVNGSEGLASFRAHHPDIVVSDIRMPVMDGLDMADAIKHERPATPVIMTTAFNESEYFLKAIDIGVDKYVMKPVKVDLLVDAIDRSARALRERSELRLAATVFATAAEAILIVDHEHRVVAANPASLKILGRAEETVRGSPLASLDPPAPAGAEPADWAAICGDAAWHGELRLWRGDGEAFPVWMSVGGARDEAGRLTHHVLVFLDITEQKRREAEILALNAELRQARDELEARVDARTRELVVARDSAEAANRAKSRFLSQMSHELRTPMNAVLGFAELLHTDDEHPLRDDQKAYTGEILRAGRHLLDMINDVLDLARVESGKISVDKDVVGLAEVFSECLDLIHPLASRRGIRVEAPCPGLDGLAVWADRLRLKQVLINLLSNAVKYNRDGGRIDIDCRAEANRLRLSVRDTGHGIGAEDMARLFRPFERFGPAAATQEGTGIGLALARRLVELMGGDIGAESTPGEGSTFWLELPLASGATADIAGAPGGTPTGLEGQLAFLQGRSVLYLEDDPTNLYFMRGLFERAPGARLITTERPESALELALSEKPDFVILDIGLPGMSGFEVLACLREYESMKGTPIIALSANAMPEEVARGRAAGFDDYLTKPVRVDTLLRVMRRLLEAGPGKTG
ncbi:MAG: response regulator [Betaproteobacteria bacterium]|nr:response regulator [Betaproteobacteria bacterium]